MGKHMRISLGALLFVVAVVAGYFAGENRGYDDGRAQWTSLPTFEKTYSVDTIVMAGLDNQRHENPFRPSGV